MIDDDTERNTVARNLPLLGTLRGRSVRRVTRYEWVDSLEEQRRTPAEIFQHGDGPVTLEFLGSGEVLLFWRHESTGTVAVAKTHDSIGVPCLTPDEIRYGVVITPIEQDNDFVAIPGTQFPLWAKIVGETISQINLLSWPGTDQGGLSLELANGIEIIIANALIEYDLDLQMGSQLTSEIADVLRRQQLW
jgi:hypothetical protein